MFELTTWTQTAGYTDRWVGVGNFLLWCVGLWGGSGRNVQAAAYLDYLTVDQVMGPVTTCNSDSFLCILARWISLIKRLILASYNEYLAFTLNWSQNKCLRESKFLSVRNFGKSAVLGPFTNRWPCTVKIWDGLAWLGFGLGRAGLGLVEPAIT